MPRGCHQQRMPSVFADTIAQKTVVFRQPYSCGGQSSIGKPTRPDFVLQPYVQIRLPCPHAQHPDCPRFVLAAHRAGRRRHCLRMLSVRRIGSDNDGQPAQPRRLGTTSTVCVQRALFPAEPEEYVSCKSASARRTDGAYPRDLAALLDT